MSETEHVCEMSLAEAAENLTRGEVAAIERHYGKHLEDGLSGTDLSAAAVWAYERRRQLSEVGRAPGEKLFDWRQLDDWTLKRLNAYFSPETVEVDPADPETEQGKGDSPDA